MRQAPPAGASPAAFLTTSIVGFALAALAACAPLQAPAAPATAFARADTLRRTPLAPGVDHVFIHDGAGPWAIHVIDIDRAACGPVLRAAKAGPPLTERAPTSSLAANALVGINADFFALPAGTTVGAHVSGGAVVIGPADRPAFAVGDTDYTAGVLVVDGFAASGGDTIPITQVNRPQAGGARHTPRGGATQRTAWLGPDAPADSGAAVVAVRVVEGDTRAGRGVVRDASAGSPATDGIAFVTREDWAHRRAAGDTVTWRVTATPGHGGGTVAEAVGGFPLLLSAGRDVLAEQPGVAASFGDARHPRTAVGWNAARLFLVVVDGRQPPWSAGMTLPELRDLFLELGATDALNLDGGGSTALAIRGRVANRPSDREGERPVGNALLLERCARS